MISAIKLASRGNKVLLFEENQGLGGAWRTEFIDQGKVEVEIACHLIENHGSSYSLLSRASGVEFRKLEPKPVKFYENAPESFYFSRGTIWREATHFSILIAATFISFFSSFGLKRLRRLREITVSSRFGIISRYLAFVRFRLPKFFIDANIQHPVGGSVALINGLIRQTRELDVDLIKARVVSLEPLITREDNQKVQLTTQCGEVYVVDRAILSNSVTLSKSEGKFRQTENPQKIFSHAVYFLPYAAICREIPYMHFVDNPEVHRVTFLDSDSALERGAQKKGRYLLVQFREAGMSSERRRELFCNLMKKHGILPTAFSIEECEEYGLFEECFYASREEAPLSTGVSNDVKNVTVVDTIGDLGRLVVLLKSYKF